MRHGKFFHVLEDVELRLDVGIKNKIKAALIEGTDAPAQRESGEIGFAGRFSPEVTVDIKLPELVIKATPDVYNGLVNLNQILISEGPEQHLR